MGLLADKVAIVTGAGRGIGKDTAELFSEHGAHVVVCDLDAGPAEETAATVRRNGGRALVLAGNICDPAEPERIMAAMAQEFGRLDILVNAAGYTIDGMVHKMTDDQFQAMLDVHLTAPFRMIRASVPLMRERAKAEIAAGKRVNRKIINVTSVAGLMGNAGQANYSAAKAGIIGLTKAVAREWAAFNINVNAIAFGLIETRLTQPKELGTTFMGSHLGIPQQQLEMMKRAIPMGRPGSAREAAAGILYLASPFSDYVNGDVVKVDGGAYM